MNNIAVSAAIMHVPGSGREQLVADALALLPKEWNPVVIEDPAREGCWVTAKRAWEARNPEATHHLVLSDDAVLCDHFGDLLTCAIEARPDAVIGLCARQRDFSDRAVLERKSWFHSQDFIYGQGIVMPTDDVPVFLDWVEDYVRPEFEHDDGRVGMWARATGRGVYTTVPQLVRHAEGRSLMGHPRAVGLGTALFAADRDRVNWATGAVEVPGNCFGGKGLRDDAPAPLRARFAAGRSPVALSPSHSRLIETSQRGFATFQKMRAQHVVVPKEEPEPELEPESETTPAPEEAPAA